jgi:serine/threonine protein kinase
MGLIRKAAKCLSGLHSSGYMHGDVKPDNFLVNVDKKDHLSVKIIDFGLSLQLEAGAHTSGNCGTRSYSAPEVLAGKNYDKKVGQSRNIVASV